MLVKEVFEVDGLEYSIENLEDLIEQKFKDYPYDKIHTIYELIVDNDLYLEYGSDEEEMFGKIFDEYLEKQK